MASYGDDFNRADGSLGANWGGLQSGETTVAGNKMRRAANYNAGLAMWQGALATDAFDVSLDFTCTGSGGQYVEILGRVGSASAVDSDVTGYGFYLEGSGSACGIERYNSGTYTVLDSGALSLTNGQTYRARLVGNGAAITAYLDGVQVFSGTDSNITSGKYAGVLTYANNVALDMDDWTAADASAPPAPPATVIRPNPLWRRSLGLR
jgi:hypothetical protein